MPNSSLGDVVYLNRIKQLRVENKMSQQELGEKLGVSRQAISLYEKGERQPNAKLWLKMSKIFEKTIKEKKLDQNISPVNYLKGYGLLEPLAIDMTIYLMHTEYFLNPSLSKNKQENKEAKRTFVNAVNSYIKASDIHPYPLDFYSDDEKVFRLNPYIKEYWRKNFTFLFDDLNIAQRLRSYLIHYDHYSTIEYISGTIDAYNFMVNKSTLGQKFKMNFAPIDEANHEQMTRQLNFAKSKDDISKIIDAYKSELDVLKKRLLK